MSSRGNLVEMREPRERGAGGSADETAQIARLGVLAGGNYWLIRLDEAQEVLAVGSITPVPLTKHWYRGLASVRGNLYSVIDFADFTTGESMTLSVDARLVLLGERFHVGAAILVERMLGLRTLAQLAPDDAAATGEYPWVRGRYRDSDGRSWRELAVSELVQHNDFLQAGL